MVKSKTPVFVCIGNPPYNREERSSEDNTQDPRNGGWVRFGDDQIDGTGILHDFVAPLTAAGLGVHAKNLYNDYVYFWRWALWKVFEAESSAGPGIVSFITAASYLRGPGFAGMRQVMRERFDDLWIIDLEGGNLGARKTENVFAIQSPVAIAVGVRYADSQPSEPARVRYTKIEGTHQEKLHALESVKSFGTLLWQECPSEWLASFLPSPVGVFPTCPLLTDLFPWQESGMQFKRSWPISEDQAVLEKRWSTLIHGSNKAALFKESRDRKITKQYPRLDGAKNKEPAVSKATDKDNPPPIGRFAYRSFDRQWALIDSRCGDYLRPTLHQTHGTKQVYMTSLLTEVLGNGPAAVATELIPDLHHFRGSFGGAHVIPLWRDPAGTIPNVTAGLVTYLSQVFGSAITAEQLFEYAYAVLATPDYVCRFWNELLQPGPRIPITADPILFQSAADVGRQLLWLHTFGERFVPKGKKRGRLPMGTAKSLKGTASDKSSYPTDYAYDPNTQELRVGTGVFSNVRSQVWGFTVSGLQVVESWLGHRMQIRAGKKSSALDDIRPAVWHFDEELLDLLWVLDATIDIIPQATAALKAILSGDLINAGDLPVPTAEERRPPILGASEDVHQESIFGG